MNRRRFLQQAAALGDATATSLWAGGLFAAAETRRIKMQLHG